MRSIWLILCLAACWIACPAGARTTLDWEKVAARTMPAVVRIDGDNGAVQGSGFVISPDGYIITNAHVVGSTRTLSVSFDDGRRLSGTVVNVDDWVDLALIRIDAGKLPSLLLAGPDSARRGQPVAAIGCPLDFPFSVSQGILSGVDRSYSDQDAVAYIQHDAAINPGSSGGPLVDADGFVLGVNTATPQGSRFDIGIALAIPAAVVKIYWERFRDGQGFAHGGLGMRVRGLDGRLAALLHIPVDSGLLVEQVDPTGSAFAAGLLTGDVITRIDDAPLSRPHQLGALLWQARPGKRITLSILRAGQPLSYLVPIDAASQDRKGLLRPQVIKVNRPNVDSAFGITLSLLAERNGSRAIVISEVTPGSAAASLGLAPGDRLLSLNGALLATVPEAMAILRDSARPLVVALIARPTVGQQYVTLQRDVPPREDRSGAFF